MTSILLIYPYFHPRRDNSIFRFPPLGITYVAASLRNAGYDVRVLDCTFTDREDAMNEAVNSGVNIVGIYSMASIKQDSLAFARALRDKCRLLIAGGPLPTCDPESFIDDFDVVVRGEGERTILDLLQAYEGQRDLESVPGIIFRRRTIGGARHSHKEVIATSPRPYEQNLDAIIFPARDLLPNNAYVAHARKKSASATTTVMTTRGCPFSCEFCSNPVFGVSYRERSPANVIDEIELALSYGYDRIHFADDVFTLRKERVIEICEEIVKRGLRFQWECLGRVDSIDADLAAIMKKAGCDRIFFGIESANESILKLMNKKITIDRARQAVVAAKAAGIKTGAFFILCYPGETNETVLNTIRFATSLPLNYLSFTLPYPVPGTALYERVKGNIMREWRVPQSLISDQLLIYKADFSEFKMKFAILKGQIQFWMQKRFGKNAFRIGKPFELASDIVFRLIK